MHFIFYYLKQRILILYMKQSKRKLIAIEDNQQVIQELYSPFTRITLQQLRKQTRTTINPNTYKSCTALFQQDQLQINQNQLPDSVQINNQLQPQVELHVMKQINFNIKTNTKDPSDKFVFRDSIVSKIIAKKKYTQDTNVQAQKYQKKSISFEQDAEYFGFNNNFRVAYPQTPGFKSLLESPFGKFNSLFKDKITTLAKQSEFKNDYRLNFELVELQTSPLLFYNKDKSIFDAGKYFIGMALRMKEQNCIPECFFLFFLACYADPYNDKTWRKYISILQEQGKLSRACTIAKTGFLLTQNQQLIKYFLLIGQKCGLQLQKIQGIMSSISNPDILQKTLLPQSAKLQIKYGLIWKGLKLLWQVCKNNDYKLSVCLITLYLARYLENIGFSDKAMMILKHSFSKSMSKLEIYLLFFQISLRKNKYVVEADFQEVLKYLDYISGENKYKLLLEIAEILYKNNDQRYYLLIGKAYEAAIQFCAPGAGNNKALKQIYYTLAKMKGILPNVGPCISDSVIFQLNRYRFVNGYQMIQYQFQDWKYYLHYGVVRKHDLLISAAKKWPLTGRILAEWIHSMRLAKSPLQMLKFWREKIQEVPKSGQLWCEGGRIYAELGEEANAQKCFRCAMHFTPQYGDSFFEELRLLLKNSRFLQIEKLKKVIFFNNPAFSSKLALLWTCSFLSETQSLVKSLLIIKTNMVKCCILYFSRSLSTGYSFIIITQKIASQDKTINKLLHCIFPIQLCFLFVKNKIGKIKTIYIILTNGEQKLNTGLASIDFIYYFEFQFIFIWDNNFGFQLKYSRYYNYLEIQKTLGLGNFLAYSLLKMILLILRGDQDCELLNHKNDIMKLIEQRDSIYRVSHLERYLKLKELGSTQKEDSLNGVACGLRK